MSQMTQLLTFDVSYNKLTAIPNILPMKNLINIAINDNKITSLPTDLHELTTLNFFRCSNNLIHSAPPSFFGLTQLQYIDMSVNSFDGPLPVNAFDGLTSLTYLDMKSNLISGPLPACLNTLNIKTLDARNNLFSSTLPRTWKFFKSLDILLADNNMLVSPISMLSTIKTVTQVSLSHNLLTSTSDDPTYRENDSAFSLMLSLNPYLISLNIAYNNWGGIWTVGTMTLNTNFTTLDMSHNHLTQFPEQIFQSKIINADFSFNNLEGVLPDAGTEPSRDFSALNVIGNPKFGIGKLPTWVNVLNQYSKSLNEPFLCPNLVSKARSTMSLHIDPSYYKYSQCICDRGTFGTAPNCFNVPESQDIDKVQFPVHTKFNDTFTDSWYGEQRMSTGLFTSWVINKQNDDSMIENSHFTTQSTNSNTNTNTPILMINVTLFINLDTFSSFTDIIDIYEGKQIVYILIVLLTSRFTIYIINKHFHITHICMFFYNCL
jgi:Leucine-rich repeat (LRR) protein